MLESKRNKAESARRNASDKFARLAEREAEFWREKEKRLSADAAKTARLRALRLGKEAADRETQANAAPTTPAARKARKPDIAS
ncbi:MAG TPA: hypothetical protein VH020_14795 [Stellaceae bacterium]|jgi:hypothetical protein|nr:hypothetical protein [Stellaceae bacterium]